VGALMVLVALVATALLNAIGLGLVSISNTEIAIASNYRQASQTLYAAEAAADCALDGLAHAASWSDVLAGATASPYGDATLTPVLPSGERVDLAAITRDLQAASDAEVRRGANNPRWRLFVHTPMARLARAPLAEEYLAAWVADDPTETDGDPLVDGNDIVMVRAQALGPWGRQRTIEATVARDAAGVSLLAWRELR
jgi:hypothetical protein